MIVVFYRYVDCFCGVLFADEQLSFKSLIVCAFPANYFAIFYVICYVLSPYISRVYRSITSKQADFLTGMVFVLFILAPTLIDIANDLSIVKNPGFLSPISLAGNGSGFTIIQFLSCLSFGMWIRKREMKFNIYIMIIVYLVSSLILTIGITKLPSLYNYCSVLTVINAVCLFMIFWNFRIQNKVINYASKSCFAIFCIHTGVFANGLWRQYLITEEHLSCGILTTLLWTAISVSAMFCGCLLLSVFMRIAFGAIKDSICEKLPVVNCDA